MQLQRYVACCVRQVPANCYTQRSTVSCYQLDVEELTGVELYARQKDEGGAWSVMRDYRQDVFVG